MGTSDSAGEGCTGTLLQAGHTHKQATLSCASSGTRGLGVEGGIGMGWVASGRVGVWEDREETGRQGSGRQGWGGQGRVEPRAVLASPCLLTQQISSRPSSWVCTLATYANSWHCQKLTRASCFFHVGLYHLLDSSRGYAMCISQGKDV